MKKRAWTLRRAPVSHPQIIKRSVNQSFRQTKLSIECKVEKSKSSIKKGYEKQSPIILLNLQTKESMPL